MLAVSLSNGLATVTLPSRIESFFRADWILHYSEKAHNAILWRCNDGVIDDKYCDALLPPLGILYRGGIFIGRHGHEFVNYLHRFKEYQFYQFRRSSVPKSDLPVLRIYITDGALGKLEKKRQIARRDHNNMLLKEEDDWVKASIVADDGKNRQETNVSLRLKGDSSNHWMIPKDSSFRIKVANNQLIWGMSKFSIQRPDTRDNQDEALILAMMRRSGVLAPRYFFVDVRINDDRGRIMALEEFFTKEMVETQNRRDGPIVAWEEDWYWGQRSFASQAQTPCSMLWSVECFDYNVGHVDLPVKVFQLGKFDPGTVHSQRMMRAVSLLRDRMADRISGDLVFDLNLVSLWWIIVGFWEAEHATPWTNSRFYFNPITDRLEPVSFDNEPGRGAISEKFPTVFAVESLLHSSVFRELTRKNIKSMEELLDSEDFKQWFTSEQNLHLSNLWVDPITPDPVVISDLRNNLSEFSRDVEILFTANPLSTKTAPLLEKVQSDPIHGRKFMESEVTLHSHIRPFLVLVGRRYRYRTQEFDRSSYCCSFDIL